MTPDHLAAIRERLNTGWYCLEDGDPPIVELAALLDAYDALQREQADLQAQLRALVAQWRGRARHRDPLDEADPETLDDCANDLARLLDPPDGATRHG